MKFAKLRFRNVVLLFALGFLGSLSASAHCDTVNGPVVAAARRALETGNLVTVLKWVRPEHEKEVRDAFARTLDVRTQGTEGRETADRLFFETVVRLHRTGEGEPYTGLKDSADVEPAVIAAAKALETGTIDDLFSRFDSHQADGIRPRFVRAVQTKQHAEDTLAAGREYVAAYVDLIHFLHGLDEGANSKSEHSHSQADAPEVTIAQIKQFSASKTQLKRNSQAKLVLAFRIEPVGAKVDWRLTCEGVAITGWDSKQVLSITERAAGGAIRTIEGHGFVGTNPAVMVTVKRTKSAPAMTAACTTSLKGNASEENHKTISFETR